MGVVGKYFVSGVEGRREALDVKGFWFFFLKKNRFFFF
jgi:hypothetical protein